jgi:hypothetical protein
MSSKEKIIEKLENSIDTLGKIKNLIKDFKLFSPEERINKLKDLEEKENKLKNYLSKIKNDILEVAFVGLEKAGKSSFVNAFIGKPLLPTADKRATYITTQVVYGENEEIEVRFYDENEFIEKIFRKMLADIEYPRAEIQTLESVSINDIDEHFKALQYKNPNLYEKHKNRLENDIKEILQGVNEIKKYLTGNTIRVPVKDKKDYENYITNPSISRAVKEVIIYSPKLDNLKNIIIYDLPGFDSPTFIHSEYTQDKIKKADAVIFIRIVKKPSLTFPEIDMISRTIEEDGLPLKEKTFFFLGMADIIHSKEDLDRNIEEFINELKKNDLFVSENRIFVGSALAHLQKLGEAKGDKALRDLENLGISTGIDEIKETLVEYNQTERLKVLNRRINTLINEIKAFLNEIEQSLKQQILNNQIDLGRDILTLSKKANTILARIQDLHKDEKIKMLNDKEPISNRLKETIKSEDFTPKEELIKSAQREVEAKSSSTEQRPDEFNRLVREEIRKNINKKFNKFIEDAIVEHINNFREKVLDIFTEELNHSKEKENEARNRIKEFLEENLSQFDYESAGLRALIDRFSGDLIELMMIPLTSADRDIKFKEVERDIYSLIAYHQDYDPNIPVKEVPVIHQILFQKEPETEESLFEKLKKVLSGKLTDEEIKEVAKEIIKKHLNADFIIRQIAKSTPYISTIVNVLELIENFAEEKKNSQISFEEIRKEIKPPQNYEDVLNEINRDIENLKDIIEKAVIRAIHPEKSYMVSLTKYVESLKTLLSDDIFDDFIYENAPIFLYEKYTQKAKSEAFNQRVQILLEDIKNLKNKLN